MKITKKETFKSYQRHKTLLPIQQMKELKLEDGTKIDEQLIVKILNLNQDT